MKSPTVSTVCCEGSSLMNKSSVTSFWHQSTVIPWRILSSSWDGFLAFGIVYEIERKIRGVSDVFLSTTCVIITLFLEMKFQYPCTNWRKICPEKFDIILCIVTLFFLHIKEVVAVWWRVSASDIVSLIITTRRHFLSYIQNANDTDDHFSFPFVKFVRTFEEYVLHDVCGALYARVWKRSDPVLHVGPPFQLS